MEQENKMLQSGNVVRATFRVGAGASAVLLICWWVLSWVLGSFIIMLIGAGSSMQMRWDVVVQNGVIFILPAVMTAILVTSRPLGMLHVDTLPSGKMLFLTISGIFVSIPFLNKIVAINESMKLPDSLSGLETMLREFEALAEQMISNIIGSPTLTSLFVCILIIGVLTGLAEELFFRGAMQSIMLRIFKNAHLAIWLTAVIFSAMHCEFFGFVPRLLLGAFLGYLTWWSGSLWLSVLAHALNNTLVVICMWIERSAGMSVAISKLGEDSGLVDWLAVVGSAVLLSIIIIYMCRLHRIVVIQKN